MSFRATKSRSRILWSLLAGACLGLAVTGILSSSPKQPVVVYPAKAQASHVILDGDQTTRIELTIRNTTSHIAEIKRLRVSCPCMKIQPNIDTPFPLTSGESRPLTVDVSHPLSAAPLNAKLLVEYTSGNTAQATVFEVLVTRSDFLRTVPRTVRISNSRTGRKLIPVYSQCGMNSMISSATSSSESVKVKVLTPHGDEPEMQGYDCIACLCTEWSADNLIDEEVTITVQSDAGAKALALFVFSPLPNTRDVL